MFFFDSRKVEYKQPFGAVPAGQPVRFCVLADCSAVTLWYRRDYEPLTSLPMAKGPDSRFSVTLTIDIPQVYWYFFECETDGRFVRYYRDPASNRPVPADDGATWQLTVYEKNEKTPSRWQGGVMENECRLLLQAFFRERRNASLPE